MTRLVRMMSIGVSFVLIALALGPAANAEPDPSDNACPRTCREQLELARAATVRFADPAVALAEGFVPRECDGSATGAQGEHWTRPDRLVDRTIRLEEPEMLLYLPSDQSRKLAALEWAMAAFVDGAPYYGEQPPDPNRTEPAPVLFGRRFDGPMPGHHPGEPWHYDLHVWAWELNPAGLFAPENPKVRCPA